MEQSSREPGRKSQQNEMEATQDLGDKQSKLVKQGRGPTSVAGWADDVFRDRTAGLGPVFVEDWAGDKRSLV